MQIDSIAEGFSVSAGLGSQGWYAGVLVRPDRDKPFIEDLGEIDSMIGAKLRPGQTDAAWEEALTGPVGLQVVLVEQTSDGARQTVIAQGDRIWGPAAAPYTDADTLLAWTEKSGDGWQLIVWRDGRKQVHGQSTNILCEPAVAEADGKPFCACQEMTPTGPQVVLMNADGACLCREPGRNPRLTSWHDRIFLVYEKPGIDRCLLQFVEFVDGKVAARCELPPGDDLNMLAAITLDPDTGAVYVVHEGTPAWGHDHFLGRHRDIYLWRRDPGASRFTAFPGRLPVPLRASHSLNEPPLQPRIVGQNGHPTVVFRRFIYYASRPFSWHVYMMQFDGFTWSRPTRISNTHGLPETDYAIVANGPDLLAAFTYCEARPPQTREDMEVGREPRGMPGRVHNTWVSIALLPLNTDLGPVQCLPNHVQGEYHISLGVRDIAPPPALNKKSQDAPKHLVWGDLHQHTLWSKCLSPVDGTRSENLRYQRDMLGCRVFSFGEHTTMMSDSEFTHYLDQMEAEAGADGIAIYGCEPWSAGHDTNLYAIDRSVFQRLRMIYQRHRTLEAILNEVKREFPNREVACLRHFHGGGEGRWSTMSPDVASTHIPEIEPAMEAMQIRGNVFMGETDAHPGLPAFPVNFLNAGCKVGLVGGTDHSGNSGPNHFCLTGFWVDAITPEAVWEALWNRQTIALANGKIAIWSTCQGQPMGTELECSGPVRINAWISSARPVTRIALMRDGQTLGWQTVDQTTAQVELVDDSAVPGPHWYSVTAEAVSSPDLARPVVGHASPFFVNLK